MLPEDKIPPGDQPWINPVLTGLLLGNAVDIAAPQKDGSCIDAYDLSSGAEAF